MAKKYHAENGALNPLGCYSVPESPFFKTRQYQKTCSWDIVREPFEMYYDPSTDMNEPTPKRWWLLPPGLIPQIFNKKGQPNSCEKLEIPYSHTIFDQKFKIIRCYCGADMCNKDYPLCKWIRKADPTWKEPLGCVEDDKFPSKKNRNYTQACCTQDWMAKRWQ